MVLKADKSSFPKQTRDKHQTAISLRNEKELFSDEVLHALRSNFRQDRRVHATIDFIEKMQRIYNIFEKETIRKNDADHTFLRNTIPYLQFIERRHNANWCFGLCVAVESIVDYLNGLNEREILPISRINQETIEDVFDYIHSKNKLVRTVNKFNSRLKEVAEKMLNKGNNASPWEDQALNAIAIEDHQIPNQGQLIRFVPKLPPGYYACPCDHCRGFIVPDAINIIHRTAFDRVFRTQKHMPTIRSRIFDECVAATNRAYPNYFQNSVPGTECKRHREALLNFFLDELICNLCSFSVPQYVEVEEVQE